MDSDLTQSEWFYKVWAWTETHRKQLLWGVGALVVLLLLGGYALYRGHQNAIEAGNALSRAIAQSAAGQAGPEAFVGVATEYPGTSAAGQALLLAGARYFAAGNYTEALNQFEKFLSEHGHSDLAGQAVYGRAAVLEATGKRDEALKAYREIVERRPNENVAPLARLAVGRLYEDQGRYEEALQQYQQLLQQGFGAIASEAVARRNELIRAHPELVQPPPMTVTSETNAAPVTEPEPPE
ncbi:MAG TPA: tetratricopeptide repeat protein [Verrucomicrobia bacterium]|nr:tetratricopeptide repeat protein [Verrucomicrobiota bacterium]HOB33244.1 tetratricopeptide repeat protein [Verrucomicrobiota bacterium]HOP96316.1 tetratricopeptide repeat protein [Verrucomicrobiota bacterium]HPU55213.1 tetratricopeptide repeat protein [Verrucomicrobiota bacterium]